MELGGLMGEVRSRAGVLGVATGVVVLAVVPVVAFAQVPDPGGVVGGVTDTAGGIVEAPAVPQLPAPVPKPPAVTAPSVQAPALPAPAPKAPEPAGALLQQASSPSGGSGSSGSGGAPQTIRSGGSARGADAPRSSGQRSDARSRASGGHRTRHRAGGTTLAQAAADPGASADTSNVAMAEDTADPLPNAPSPAKSPFTGLALGLLFIIGLCALTAGTAIRAATRLHIRRATS